MVGHFETHTVSVFVDGGSNDSVPEIMGETISSWRTITTGRDSLVRHFETHTVSVFVDAGSNDSVPEIMRETVRSWRTIWQDETVW